MTGTTPGLEPGIAATAATLNYLAGWVGTDEEQARLREIARAVLDLDTRDICCPFCQEIQCDNDCPLYPVRLSWGCWVAAHPSACSCSECHPEVRPEVLEIARKNTGYLFADADDENWLGV